MRDKTHFSFLIALARQLEIALTQDVDDVVAESIDSLGASMEALLVITRRDDGEDASGDAEGVESSGPVGDAAPLGGALEERLAALEQRAAASVELAPRRRVGGIAPERVGLAMGRKRHRTPVLKGKRRGKK